jgi:hypothetical protein
MAVWNKKNLPRRALRFYVLRPGTHEPAFHLLSTGQPYTKSRIRRREIHSTHSLFQQSISRLFCSTRRGSRRDEAPIARVLCLAQKLSAPRSMQHEPCRDRVPAWRAQARSRSQQSRQLDAHGLLQLAATVPKKVCQFPRFGALPIGHRFAPRIPQLPRL